MEEQPFDFADAECELDTDEKFNLCLGMQEGGTGGRKRMGKGLTFLGLVASIDPERDGVADAVVAAKEGFIRVVMITGDYLPTARAIGHNVNILEDSDGPECALDCKALRPERKEDGDDDEGGNNNQNKKQTTKKKKKKGNNYLPDDEIDQLTRTVKVFARAQPEDKLTIVASLQRQGLVSAMTGDGVNDAPALKRADIGVAMGLQGTEVAKGASDMVLTDDNFCSIVTAVEKGRVIYAGIQKFVAFILSVHLAEVLQIFVCIVAQIPIMRTPLQILFLILVTDLPPSVALGMERCAANILKQRPRPKKQAIMVPWMWQGIVVNALILSATTMSVYVWGLSYYLGIYSLNDILQRIQVEDSQIGGGLLNPNASSTTEGLMFARTAAFISLVWSENVRAYTSRSFTDPVWTDLCGNRAMQFAIAFAQVALYVAVFVPGLSTIVLDLDGIGVDWPGWVAAVCGALATLILCELYKLAQRPQVRAAERKQQAAQEEAERVRMEEVRKRTRAHTENEEAGSMKKKEGEVTKEVEMGTGKFSMK